MTAPPGDDLLPSRPGRRKGGRLRGLLSVATIAVLLTAALGRPASALAEGPVAAADRHHTVPIDGALVVTLVGTVEPGGTLAFSIDTPPADGDLGPIGAPACSGLGTCTTTVTYTPIAGFEGSDSFVYGVDDGSSQATATVTIAVAATTSAPVAADDPAGPCGLPVLEDSIGLVLPGTILANDTDADGDSLTTALVVQAGHGTATVHPDGAISYVPDADYAAPGCPDDTFTYAVSDGVHASGPATIRISIVGVNDAPSFMAGDDVTVDEDAGPQTITAWATSISAGPPDEAAQTLAFSAAASDPSLFAAGPAIVANGTLTFTPAANAHGTTSVQVTLTDGGGTANGGDDSAGSQTFDVVITSVNDAPFAGDDPSLACDFTDEFGGSFPIPEDTGPFGLPAGFDACSLDANDGDVDGDDLAYELVDGPAHGDLHLGEDGSYEYTPDADHSTPAGSWESDAFTYRVSDGTTSSPTATMRFWVAPVNDAPTFSSGGNVSLAEDGGPSSSAWATEISPGPANESAQAVSFEVTDVVGPAGLFSTAPTIGDGGALSLTPAPNRHGSAQVTVVAHDDGGLESYPGVSISPDDTSDPVTFTITVTPVNDPPVAGNDAFTVLEDSGLTVLDLLGNDGIGPDAGETLAVVDVGDPAFGTLTLNGGVVRYRPSLNGNGSADFGYTVSDGGGLTDTGSVDMTVTPVNDAPGFTKGPNQTVAEDSGAHSIPGWATSISKGPANESSQAVGFSVTGNTNPSLFSSAPAITSTGRLTFTPALNAAGSATISIRLTDNGGTANGGTNASGTQSFAITVTAVNDPPAFTAGSDQSVLEDAAAQTISGWATGISKGPPNESGQSLAFAIVDNSDPGLFAAGPAVTAAGRLTYTPAEDANGTATVTVRLDDSGGASSASRTFTIDIGAVNDAPGFTKGPNQTVPEDSGQATVAGWATAFVAGPTDESGQAVTVGVTGNTNPALFAAAPAVASDGTLTFKPAANRSGNATITLAAADDGGTADGGHDTGPNRSFTIKVSAVNDPPSATNDVASIEAGSAATAIDVLANDSAVPDAGETLTVAAIVTSPAHGEAVVAADDGVIGYTPDVGFTGIDTFSYRIADGHGGTDTATVRVTVTADITAPTVAAPAATFTSGGPATGTTARIRVAWTAADGSGVSTVQVQRSVAGAAYGHVALGSPTALSVTQDVAVGPTVRYRVRATDGAGNLSPWRYGPALAVGRTQESDAAVVYSGGTWSPRNAGGTTDGKLRFATTAGATFTHGSTGRAIGIVAKPEAGSGSADIYVDGVKLATVDFGAAAGGSRVVWARSWSTQAPRTLKVVVKGTGRLDLDAIVVLRDR